MAYNLKIPKEKKEKDLDIFNLPKEKQEEKSDSFSMKGTEEEHIQEINDDLYSDSSPIKIKNKNTLLVEANGTTHTITKNDVVSYHERYRLDGVDGRDTHGFRNIGTIKGDYELIDKIYQDSNHVFQRIDEHTGGYKTIPDDND